MAILPHIRTTLQEQFLPCVPKKWHPMFLLGFNALSLQPLRSLNGNARLARENPTAAMMQLYRLCHHCKFLRVFSCLLVRFHPLTNDSVIIVDFTIFHPFAVLCFALQTEEGRAVPVWLDVLKYPVQKDSQNLFILEALDSFLTIVGCRPKLVCDRGFIGKTLIQGFMKRNLLFYVRMKVGKTFVLEGKKKVLRGLRTLDTIGKMYHRKLRVVRSSKTLMKRVGAKECWYIITNDFDCSRATILSCYYYRFEIEETFKDIKHLLQASVRWITRVQTLKTLLWFQVLGLWLLKGVSMLCHQYFHHKKKQLSWVRIAWEAIQRELLQSVFPISTRLEVSIP